MEKFDKLVWVVNEVRNKCPWDKKQSHESLKKYFIEEVYEALEAIDNQNFKEFENELGDVLLQILLHAEIASEKKYFSIDGVIDQITEKMITRHPHVFGEKANSAISSDEVLENWELIKAKSAKKKTLLSGIPSNLPALIRAQRIQEKTASVGFDWNSLIDVFEKVKEEILELEQEIKTENNDRIKAELGDVIFALVNLGRHLKIDVEDCLQQTNKKIINRFEYIEKQYDSLEKIKKSSIEELDNYWNEAKKNELK